MCDPSSVAPLYRLLQAADLRAAQRLRELAHWNQTDQDWLNLLAMEPQGCFAAEVNGQVIGTATTTRFLPASGAGSFGWVGMLLVHPDYRGHGIGSTLLQRAIGYLHGRGVETVKLDATPLGRPVYLKHGFQEECDLERWTGTASPLQAPVRAVRALAASDLGAVIAYDAAAFGAERGAIVRNWFQAWPECALAAWEEQRLVGYALARRGAHYHQAGPIVCDTPETGHALLARMFELLAGRQAIVDIFSENAWVREFVERAGFSKQRPLVRMYQGPNAAPGQRRRIAAIAGPEIG